MHKIKKKPYMWFTIVQYCTLDTVKFKASALKIDQGSITDVPRTDEIQLPQQQLPQLHLPQQQLSQTTPNYPTVTKDPRYLTGTRKRDPRRRDPKDKKQFWSILGVEAAISLPKIGYY